MNVKYQNKNKNYSKQRHGYAAEEMSVQEARATSETIKCHEASDWQSLMAALGHLSNIIFIQKEKKPVLKFSSSCVEIQ